MAMNKYVMRAAGVLGAAAGKATMGFLVYWALIGLNDYGDPWRFLAGLFFLQALWDDYRAERAKEALSAASVQSPGVEDDR